MTAVLVIIVSGLVSIITSFLTVVLLEANLIVLAKKNGEMCEKFGNLAKTNKELCERLEKDYLNIKETEQKK